jgi:Zn-dependent peptidase ImmA (M78 family)
LGIVELDLADSVAGALSKEPGRNPKIKLNSRHPLNRRRFTCAHELGHYARRSHDDDEYEWIDYRDNLSSTGIYPEEVYANEYASCLLMPELVVRRMYVERALDWEIAKHFDVSCEAVQFRLARLGLDI